VTSFIALSHHEIRLPKAAMTTPLIPAGKVHRLDCLLDFNYRRDTLQSLFRGVTMQFLPGGLRAEPVGHAKAVPP
jgi:hypothetical protein